MAANEFSEFTQENYAGKGGARPATGKRSKQSFPTVYKCPSWGNTVKARGVGWGGDTVKAKVYPKSKGVASGS